MLHFGTSQNHMDLAKGHIKALQEGDLASSRGIEACTNAADALLQCMNVALRPGMFIGDDKMWPRTWDYACNLAWCFGKKYMGQMV